MDERERYSSGMRVRRAVLGEDYVEKAQAATTPRSGARGLISNQPARPNHPDPPSPPAGRPATVPGQVAAPRSAGGWRRSAVT